MKFVDGERMILKDYKITRDQESNGTPVHDIQVFAIEGLPKVKAIVFPSDSISPIGGL